MNGPVTPQPPERLLTAIRLVRGLMLFAMMAAVLLIVAAVVARTNVGLILAAKLTSLFAALVAATLLVLNLLALRAWQRARTGRTRTGKTRVG